MICQTCKSGKRHILKQLFFMSRKEEIDARIETLQEELEKLKDDEQGI